MAAMLCDVVVVVVVVVVIHAASHFDHKKRVAWVPISMHVCGSFFYNYGAPIGGPSGRRSSAIMVFRFCSSSLKISQLPPFVEPTDVSV